MEKSCEKEGNSISIWALAQQEYTCLSCGRFLEILSYGNKVVVMVSTVAASQIEYTTSFYWRSRTSDIFVICLDSEARVASLLNTMCHGWPKSCSTTMVYGSMHLLFFLCNWNSCWHSSSFPDALLLGTNIMFVTCVKLIVHAQKQFTFATDMLENSKSIYSMVKYTWMCVSGRNLIIPRIN